MSIAALACALHCVNSAPLSAQTPRVAQTEVVFTVGFDESRLYFGFISQIAMAPDGRVLVHDMRPADGPAVTVLSPTGDVLARWGTTGEGPGELPGGPAGVSVEGDTVVVAALRHLGIYTWAGREIGRSATTEETTFLDVSRSAGRTFAWRLGFHVGDDDFYPAVFFGPADGQETWNTRVLNTFPPVGSGAFPLRSRPILASIPEGRTVVGYGDEYALQVISGESGDTVMEVRRETPRRAPSEVETFLEKARYHLRHPRGAPAAWSSLVQRGDAPRSMLPYDIPLPVIRRVFWGPPGVLWVERGLGIDDRYSQPLERPDDNRMWDLFEIGDDAFEYVSPVSLPMGFHPLAGNHQLLAGVVEDEMDRQAIRVLRVTVP